MVFAFKDRDIREKASSLGQYKCKNIYEKQSNSEFQGGTAPYLLAEQLICWGYKSSKFYSKRSFPKRTPMIMRRRLILYEDANCDDVVSLKVVAVNGGLHMAIGSLAYDWLRT